MKKLLLMIALWSGAFFAMEKTEDMVAWKDKLVDQSIVKTFNDYFIQNKKENSTFNQERMKDFENSLSQCLYTSLKYHFEESKIKIELLEQKINKIVNQFISNVTEKEKNNNANALIESKEIDAHNKKVHNNKSEIKKLLIRYPNLISKVGGLAALIYEYSDRDESLNIFKRQISLRSNGYWKEYFLFPSLDDLEKIDKVRNSFQEIKTHRPKSWSSLVGLGNGYVDKRGWLSYSYDKLKLPALIGGGILAYRNRDAIAKKFDESGIKESDFGKWVGEKYTAAKESGAAKYQYLKNVGSSVRATLGGMYENASNYLSNYYAKKRQGGQTDKSDDTLNEQKLEVDPNNDEEGSPNQSNSPLSFNNILNNEENELREQNRQYQNAILTEKQKVVNQKEKEAAKLKDLLWLQTLEQNVLDQMENNKSTGRFGKGLKKYTDMYNYAYRPRVESDPLIQRVDRYDNDYKDYQWKEPNLNKSGQKIQNLNNDNSDNLDEEEELATLKADNDQEKERLEREEKERLEREEKERLEREEKERLEREEKEKLEKRKAESIRKTTLAIEKNNQRLSDLAQERKEKFNKREEERKRLKEEAIERGTRRLTPKSRLTNIKKGRFDLL